MTKYLKLLLAIYILIVYPEKILGQNHKFYGDKKLFDKIMTKVIDNVEKNYYIDSIQPIKYSEYTYIDSSKHLLNAIFIKGVCTSPWMNDYAYITKKYKINYNLMLPQYWQADMYEESPDKSYGRYASWSGKLNIPPFWSSALNDIAQYISIKSKKRREREEYSQKSEMNIIPYQKPSHIIGKAIYTTSNEWENFEVKDTSYQNEDCYVLIRTYEIQTQYGEKEKKQFEERIKNDSYLKDTIELKRLTEQIWKNCKMTGYVKRIINKKDHAELYLLSSHYYINENDQKYLESSEENIFSKFGKKYKQALYKSLKLLYANNTIYPNDKDIYTYIIKTPLYEYLSYDKLKTIPNNIEYGYLGYKVFCTRVDSPTPEMLEEWNKFLK